MSNRWCVCGCVYFLVWSEFYQKIYIPQWSFWWIIAKKTKTKTKPTSPKTGFCLLPVVPYSGWIWYCLIRTIFTFLQLLCFFPPPNGWSAPKQEEVVNGNFLHSSVLKSCRKWWHKLAILQAVWPRFLFYLNINGLKPNEPCLYLNFSSLYDFLHNFWTSWRFLLRWQIQKVERISLKYAYSSFFSPVTFNFVLYQLQLNYMYFIYHCVILDHVSYLLTNNHAEYLETVSSWCQFQCVILKPGKEKISVSVRPAAVRGSP